MLYPSSEVHPRGTPGHTLQRDTDLTPTLRFELRGERPTTTGLLPFMNTAVSDAMIVRSPCQVKGAGQVQCAERPVPSVPELTAAIEALPDRLRVAALLAAWCQLRRGEVLG
jgi:hypothetical protein